MINTRIITPTITIGILDLKKFSAYQPIVQKRELEKAGVQFLLSHLLNTTCFELNYYPTNKPFLKGRPEYISISHSHNKLAIIINQLDDTGIDIELIRDKVLGVRHKFLNEAELAAANDNVDTLITYWAAKEALYKTYGLKEIDFKKNLMITKYNNPTIIGSIKTTGFTKQYQLIAENLEEYKMVYVLNEF